MAFTDSGVGSDFTAGRQVAGYRIVEEIGRGGMAVVYRARDVRLDRWVALKILARDVARNRAYQQRFIRESKAAAAVDHPNIIPIFDAGEADGVLYIAMRYVRDRDVGSLIDLLGRLPAPRAVSITTQVASALDAAHAAGLVHRDVKPANILLGNVAENDMADHVYLSDFGISMLAGNADDTAAPADHGLRQPDITARLTVTGEYLGTMQYAAPEQVQGLPVDRRADVYSLACAVYEMLAGRPPFADVRERLAVFPAPPPPMSRWRSDLPPAVDQVLAKALAVAPDDRYDNCRALATALAEACGLGTAPAEEEFAVPETGPRGTPPGPDRDDTPGERSPAANDRGTPPTGRRRRRGIIVAAACAAVLAASGALALWYGTTTRPEAAVSHYPKAAIVSLPAIPTPMKSTAGPTARATPHGVASTARSTTASAAASAAQSAATSAAASAAASATPSAAPSHVSSSPAPSSKAAAACPTAAAANISADCYTGALGTVTIASTTDPSPAGVDANQAVQLSNGHYLEYRDINFGSGSMHFTARVACGAPLYASGGVEVVLDNPANKSVGGFSIANTGGWNSWKFVGTTMTDVTGIHNVYIVLTSGGPAPYLSLHYFSFAPP